MGTDHMEVLAASLSLAGSIIVVFDLWRRPTPKLARRLEIQAEIDDALVAVLRTLTSGGTIDGTQLDHIATMVSAARLEDLTAQRNVAMRSRWGTSRGRLGVLLMLVGFLLAIAAQMMEKAH